MTLEQVVKTLESLPAEKREVVARLIELLAETDTPMALSTLPSWCGILKEHGVAPSFEEFEEARRECWSFERESAPL